MFSPVYDVSSSLFSPSPRDDRRLMAGEASFRGDISARMGVEWFGVELVSSDSNVSLPYSSGMSSGIELFCDRDGVCILSSGIVESHDLLFG